MSVNLRGGQINVPQELLNRPQIRPPFEEMGGEGMAEGMRERSEPGTHDTPDPSGVQRPAPGPHPQGIGRSVRRHRLTALLDPTPNGVLGGPADRDDPHPPTFARDPDLGEGADVGEPERGQLRYPQSGGVQQFEERTVTQRHGVVTIDQGECVVDRPAREGLGKTVRCLRPAESTRRAGRPLTAPDQILEERPDRRSLASHRGSGVPRCIEVGEEPANGAAVDGVELGDIMSSAKVEELGEISPVGGHGVRRETPFGLQASQIGIDLETRPIGDRRSCMHDIDATGSPCRRRVMPEPLPPGP